MCTAAGWLPVRSWRSLRNSNHGFVGGSACSLFPARDKVLVAILALLGVCDAFGVWIQCGSTIVPVSSNPAGVPSSVCCLAISNDDRIEWRHHLRVKAVKRRSLASVLEVEIVWAHAETEPSATQTLREERPSLIPTLIL